MGADRPPGRCAATPSPPGGVAGKYVVPRMCPQPGIGHDRAVRGNDNRRTWHRARATDGDGREGLRREAGRALRQRVGSDRHAAEPLSGSRDSGAGPGRTTTTGHVAWRTTYSDTL